MPTNATILRRAIRFEGIEGIQAKLASIISSTTGKQAKDVYVSAAIIGRDAIRNLAPVKSGRLKSAIFAAAGEESKPNALLGVNYKIAPHAHLVEFGHGGPHPAGPHPYYRPGITHSASRMAARIKEGLQDVIDKGAQK